jgi:hypothetical protein
MSCNGCIGDTLPFARQERMSLAKTIKVSAAPDDSVFCDLRAAPSVELR